MTFFKKIVLVLACSFPSLLQAQADTLQDFGERADALLDCYSAEEEKSKLYLHLDKNIYTPNETIWFSAHLLEDSMDMHEYRILYIQLVGIGNDSLVRASSFLMEGGHSHGDILLPGDIPPGEYRLIAYMDKMKNRMPSLVFQQRLSIKTPVEPPFTVRVKLTDSLSRHPDSLTLMINFNWENRPTTGEINCNYQVLGGRKTIIRGKLTTNYLGQAFIRIARSAIENRQLVFRGNFTNTPEGKKFVELPIKYHSRKINLSFYPESGILLQNKANRIAMEALLENGNPVITDIHLYANENRIATCTTGQDGVAVISLSFYPNIQYSARILTKDSTWEYQLPPVAPEGYLIQVSNAVADDTLSLTLAKEKPGFRVKLLLHNFRQLYWFAGIVSGRANAPIRIPTSDIPDGLYALTLVNDNMQPLAERLIMIRHRNTAITIQTDKMELGVRERITLSLSLPGGVSANDSARLSVSCADISRLNEAQMGNILTAFIVGDQFDKPAFNQFLLFERDDTIYKRANNMLLTRGWRKYNWTEALACRQMPAAIPEEPLLPGKGKITGGKTQGPYEVAIINNGRAGYIQSDSAGYFRFELPDLMISGRKNILITPFRDKDKTLKVMTDTLPIHIQKKINHLEYPPISLITISEISSSRDVIPMPFGYKVLQDVVVGAQKKIRFNSKNCRDFVCQYNVLNCEYHPGMQDPVEGETYLYRFNMGEIPKNVIYSGCNNISDITPENFIRINGINFGKQFYKSDYQKTPLAESELLTTLYWNPLVKLKGSIPFTDTFFSSDWKGTYRIIVEGMVGRSPVHSEHTIVVK